MEATAVQQVEEEKHFHKIQLVDQNKLEEHLDSLQVLFDCYSANKG